jgi:hypothetical protein
MAARRVVGLPASWRTERRLAATSAPQKASAAT